MSFWCTNIILILINYMYIFITVVVLDECSDPDLNGCDSASNATCEDLDSGYKCNCPTGYIISDNQYICEGMYMITMRYTVLPIYISILFDIFYT